MIVDLGEEPVIKRAIFQVTANIYSERENNYIHNWFGGEFSSYDRAYEFWNDWDPPKEEVDLIMKKQRESGDYSHHELEIGIWSLDQRETSNLAFMNTTLDFTNERRC